MSAPATPAIFLSYAREDLDAARRIADALRSHGIEAWFDQSELRGGDTWDQKIRRQIKDCTLFVPIISARTQERREGYFRLEWKLAAERTHLMAEGVPFIAPIVVDATTEAAAVVPAEFMRVQWTRLPGALATPQFIEQIKRLLAPPADVARVSRAVFSGPPGRETRATKNSAPLFVAIGVAVVAVGVAAFFALRPSPKEPPAPAKPIVAETKSAPAAPVVSDKSIAVLPFDNLSTDKENGFFADGIHEDVLSALQNIRELRVVSRTTVMQYREKTKPLPQIARELGVTYILEGSVRRAGNKVRVSAELIDARTDTHLWALPAGEHELTNIFAVQAQLAQAIATELKATLSPREKSLLDRRPTENLAAYDLFLKARDSRNRERVGRTSVESQVNLLQSAVALDPNFASAWADLAATHGQAYFSNFDVTASRRAKAKAAIDAAVRLAPESPDVIRNLGNYYFLCFRDYPRATEQFEKLIRLQPNDATAYGLLGNLQSRQGKWLEALANLRRATQLDPANLNSARVLVNFLLSGRRYDEATVEQRRIVALVPDDLPEAYNLAAISFRATGSQKTVQGWLNALPPTQKNSPPGLSLQKNWAYFHGDLAEHVRLDRLQPSLDVNDQPPWVMAGRAVIVLKALGDEAGVRARQGDLLAELRSRVDLDPANATLWLHLGINEAMLGHKEEALRCGRKLVELVPESSDAMDGPTNSRYLAAIQAWAGDKDRAIAELARLLRIPAGGGPFFSVHVLRHGPLYAPLRGDARFEALLNDPKNNAPLF